jgi:uncharacterized protein
MHYQVHKYSTKVIINMEKRAVLGDIHSSGQFIFTLGVGLFTTLITLALGFLMATPFVDKSVFELMEGIEMGDSSSIGFMKYLQIVSHLGMFIIPSIIVAWFLGRYVIRYLYLDKLPETKVLILSALLIFVAVPFINYILELNSQMHFHEYLRGIEEWMRRSEENAERMTKMFLKVETLNGLFFNLFMIAVIPAIGEELMFRGVLMRIFSRWTSSGHLAVWITAIVFSAIHIQFFGFFPRMILGVLFGYLVLYTGSLWPAIIAHFVNNAAAVIFYYLFHQQIVDGTFENIGKGNEGLIYALISLVLTLAIIWWIRKNSTKASPRLEQEPELS